MLFRIRNEDEVLKLLTEVFPDRTTQSRRKGTSQRAWKAQRRP